VHTVAGLMSLKIATFALGYASTFLFGGLNRLNIVFKMLRLGTALSGAAFSSFFKGIMPLVGIALIIYENWEPIKEFFMKIWEEVEPHWLKFKAILDEYGVIDKIMNAWTSVSNFFTTIWDTAQIYWLKFKAILDEYGVVDKIMAAWTTVRDFYINIWSSVTARLNTFIEKIQELNVVDKIMVAWTTVRDFYITFWSAPITHWNEFIKKIQELNVVDKIMASWQRLKTFFTTIWDDVAPKWDKFISPLSKIWNGAKSSVSSIGSLFQSDGTKPSITSKLPPINSAKAAPVTKNQNVTVAVNVNASKISDPREIAKKVSEEMKSFNWNYLYDPVGELI
jgi:phage-related protein